MPPAGLLRDNPPKARLRIRRCACICHRQRLAPDLQRKATRGSVLWTPLKGGERKGETRVAACAVRRGLEPRIPLTLNCTSDRDFTPLLHAARKNRKRLNKNTVIASQCSHWRGNPTFCWWSGRPPLQVQSGILIPGSAADGAAIRHGLYTGAVPYPDDRDAEL